MGRVAALEIARRGRTTAIVIDKHRVFFRGIERGRQVVAGANRVASRTHEVPILAVAERDVTVKSGVLVFNEGRFLRFQVGQVTARAVRRAHARPRGQRLRFCQRKATDAIFRSFYLIDFQNFSVSREKVDFVAVVGGEIEFSVSPTPLEIVDARIERARERRGLARGDIDEIELVVVHTRRSVFGQVLADAAKRFGRTFHRERFAVGRELRRSDKTVVFDNRVGGHRLQIEPQNRVKRCRTLGEPTFRGDQQHVATVVGNVQERCVVMAVGERLGDTSR